MEIRFKDKKVRELCESKVVAERKLGAASARKLRTRLGDLESARSVTDLVAGNPHLRIPRDGGHDSMLMADSVPAGWRTPFHAEGGQHSKLMADTGGVFGVTRTRHTLSGFLTGTSDAHTQGHHEQTTTHTATAARRGLEHPLRISVVLDIKFDSVDTVFGAAVSEPPGSLSGELPAAYRLLTSHLLGGLASLILPEVAGLPAPTRGPRRSLRPPRGAEHAKRAETVLKESSQEAMGWINRSNLGGGNPIGKQGIKPDLQTGASPANVIRASRTNTLHRQAECKTANP